MNTLENNLVENRFSNNGTQCLLQDCSAPKMAARYSIHSPPRTARAPADAEMKAKAFWMQRLFSE